MDVIGHIKKSVDDIEFLLSQIKADLALLETGPQITPKHLSAKPEELPSEEEMQKLYQELFDRAVKGDPNTISNFVMSSTKAYLKAFCKANSLPIDTKKSSKRRIIMEITQWMAQRRAILKEAI